MDDDLGFNPSKVKLPPPEKPAISDTTKERSVEARNTPDVRLSFATKAYNREDLAPADGGLKEKEGAEPLVVATTPEITKDLRSFIEGKRKRFKSIVPAQSREVGLLNNNAGKETKEDKAVASKEETENAVEAALLRKGAEDIRYHNEKQMERDLEDEIKPQPGGDGPPIKPPSDKPFASAFPPPGEPPTGHELIKREPENKPVPNLNLLGQYYRRRQTPGLVPTRRRTDDTIEGEYRIINDPSDERQEGQRPPSGAGAGGGTTPPIPPTPGRNNRNSRMPTWAKRMLHAKSTKAGTEGFATIMHLLGQLGGGVARATGNLGAALDTGGAAQKSYWGTGGGAAASQIFKGLSEIGGTGAETLSDITGTLPGIFLEPGAEVMHAMATDQEAEVLQEAMLQKMLNHIDNLSRRGIDINRAGIWDYLKNYVNSYGMNALTNLIRTHNNMNQGAGNAHV